MTVDWQNSLAPMLLLFGLLLAYFATTFRAKNVSCPKSCSTHRAREFDAVLEMLDDYCALVEVYILDL